MNGTRASAAAGRETYLLHAGPAVNRYSRFPLVTPSPPPRKAFEIATPLNSDFRIKPIRSKARMAFNAESTWQLVPPKLSRKINLDRYLPQYISIFLNTFIGPNAFYNLRFNMTIERTASRVLNLEKIYPPPLTHKRHLVFTTFIFRLRKFTLKNRPGESLFTFLYTTLPTSIHFHQLTFTHRKTIIPSNDLLFFFFFFFYS